jgi:hypothetical protein
MGSFEAVAVGVEEVVSAVADAVVEPIVNMGEQL